MSITLLMYFLIFFFKRKTAFEMRISDWSSDVCSSALVAARRREQQRVAVLLGARDELRAHRAAAAAAVLDHDWLAELLRQVVGDDPGDGVGVAAGREGHHHRDRPLGIVRMGRLGKAQGES